MSDVKVSNKQAVTPRAIDPHPTLVPFGRMFALSPFALMREFAGELDRLASGVGAAGSETMLGKWSPAIDVQRVNGNLLVTAELPGVKKDDVKVEVTDNTLFIHGERKLEHTEDQHGYRRVERSYGDFYRAVTLPEGANTEQVKAELQDGLLKVTVPVAAAEPKSRQIPIQSQPAATAAKA